MLQKQTKKSFLVKRTSLVVMALLLAFSSLISVVPTVKADQFDERIRQLQNEIDSYQSKANALREQANTFQVAVDSFNAQIAIIQGEINLSQAQLEQLTSEIKVNEDKIVRNQDVLGDTIAAIYVDDKISPLEMLASSKNISEYVDKQEQRSSFRDTLATAIKDIKRIKKELEEQRVKAEQILNDQKGRRTVLEAKKTEQQALVDQTKGEEAAYQSLASQSRAAKDEVQRRQQAAINAAMRGSGRAVAGDPRKGGYPAEYANADYYDYIADKWGMYARQCVSYVAWKVEQKNGYMPYWGGDRYVTVNGRSVFTSGHARYWPTSAAAAGIPTGSTARERAAGVITSGDYGHIVWVESVNYNGPGSSDDTVNISQYNFFNAGGSGWGHYSEMYDVPASTYDTYIYF